MSDIIQDKNQDSNSEFSGEDTQPGSKAEECKSYDPIAAIKEDLVSTAADKVEEQKKESSTEQDGQKSLDENKAPKNEGKDSDSPEMKDSQSGKDPGSSSEEKGSASESKDADKKPENKKKDHESSSEEQNLDKKPDDEKKDSESSSEGKNPVPAPKDKDEKSIDEKKDSKSSTKKATSSTEKGIDIQDTGLVQKYSKIDKDEGPKDLFYLFQKYAESGKGSNVISLDLLQRWLMQAEFIGEGTDITTQYVEDLFKKCTNNENMMNFDQFQDFLHKLNDKMKKNPTEMMHQILSAGKPQSATDRDWEFQMEILESLKKIGATAEFSKVDKLEGKKEEKETSNDKEDVESSKNKVKPEKTDIKEHDEPSKKEKEKEETPNVKKHDEFSKEEKEKEGSSDVKEHAESSKMEKEKEGKLDVKESAESSKKEKEKTPDVKKHDETSKGKKEKETSDVKENVESSEEGKSVKVSSETK
ncbi:uncharacterized protein TNCT_470261 [Trichonephila clavata]|uniref:Uncharacterized protein n=1 Tax=Trichonephila clavata TaxID=2740835 RepID=A0A8X6EYQ1_TRICU|nr:uncharacterized protein TNCT_470261 [Trichonephila clavata]